MSDLRVLYLTNDLQSIDGRDIAAVMRELSKVTPVAAVILQPHFDTGVLQGISHINISEAHVATKNPVKRIARRAKRQEWTSYVHDFKPNLVFRFGAGLEDVWLPFDIAQLPVVEPDTALYHHLYFFRELREFVATLAHAEERENPRQLKIGGFGYSTAMAEQDYWLLLAREVQRVWTDKLDFVWFGRENVFEHAVVKAKGEQLGISITTSTIKGAQESGLVDLMLYCSLGQESISTYRMLPVLAPLVGFDAPDPMADYHGGYDIALPVGTPSEVAPRVASILRELPTGDLRARLERRLATMNHFPAVATSLKARLQEFSTGV